MMIKAIFMIAMLLVCSTMSMKIKNQNQNKFVFMGSALAVMAGKAAVSAAASHGARKLFSRWFRRLQTEQEGEEAAPTQEEIVAKLNEECAAFCKIDDEENCEETCVNSGLEELQKQE